MKRFQFKKIRFKIWISMWLVMLVMTLNEPINARSDGASIYLDWAIYAEKSNDYVNAAKYLEFYKQSNPYEYVNNIGGQKSIIDARLKYYAEETIYAITLKQVVKKDVENGCGHYPCDQASLSVLHAEVPLQPFPPPPNGAMLCTGRNYTGLCKILTVGEYVNFTQMNINDQISSVMIGSQVRLVMYRHARFDPPFKAFTSSDADLRDNWLDSTTSWNDIASAAIVSYR